MKPPYLYDISQKLHANLPVWPGDTAFESKRTWAYGPESPVNVSLVTHSTHAGTHADAPLHYDPEGGSVNDLDLARYIGPCRVVDGRHFGPLILPEHVADFLHQAPPRLLFRTYATFPHDRWKSDFTAIHADTIDLLARNGVFLVGVDAPSLDAETSKTMDAHLAVKRQGLSILEGLVLDAVPPGDYELIALPINFADLDAAPVRAVLRALPQ
jgi:arylformamidase